MRETVAHQALVRMGTLGLVRGPHQILADTFTLFQSGEDIKLTIGLSPPSFERQQWACTYCFMLLLYY